MTRLHAALDAPATRPEALEITRRLIERVVRPGAAGPEIELAGDLAAMVGLAGDLAAMVGLADNKKAALEGAAVREALARSAKMVAGAGFEPTTFRL